jgi:hypothetical protein
MRLTVGRSTLAAVAILMSALALAGPAAASGPCPRSAGKFAVPDRIHATCADRAAPPAAARTQTARTPDSSAAEAVALSAFVGVVVIAVLFGGRAPRATTARVAGGKR